MYVPDQLPAGAPLVVVLHGGSQSAFDYDAGSGWSRLADRLGFALLFPEQRRSNNALLCFNWYETSYNGRAAGEALSIRQMTDALVTRRRMDPGRVYVTGLSAGAAMAAMVMATYPDAFAGGALIAGLPYGCAVGMFQAMDRMHGLGGPTARQLEASVRAASRHQGPWPVLSVWHGTADRTVDISNVESILGQWRLLHGLPPMPSSFESENGFERRVWCDEVGREILESYSITGMGHGIPLKTDGLDGFGIGGTFTLDVKVGSTLRIAQFWGLAPAASATPRTAYL